MQNNKANNVSRQYTSLLRTFLSRFTNFFITVVVLVAAVADAAVTFEGATCRTDVLVALADVSGCVATVCASETEAIHRTSSSNAI